MTGYSNNRAQIAPTKHEFTRMHAYLKFQTLPPLSATIVTSYHGVFSKIEETARLRNQLLHESEVHQIRRVRNFGNDLEKRNGQERVDETAVAVKAGEGNPEEAQTPAQSLQRVVESGLHSRGIVRHVVVREENHTYDDEH